MSTDHLKAPNAAAVGPYVAWLFKHYAALVALVGYLQQVATGTMAEKKEAIKAAIDLVWDALADFPTTDGLVSAHELKAYCEHPAVGAHLGAKFDGHIIQWIITNGPQVIAFIQQIIGLFSKTGA